MEYCITSNLHFKKSFKSDYCKSVKHQEKLGQYHCKNAVYI